MIDWCRLSMVSAYLLMLLGFNAAAYSFVTTPYLQFSFSDPAVWFAAGFWMLMNTMLIGAIGVMLDDY